MNETAFLAALNERVERSRATHAGEARAYLTEQIERAERIATLLAPKDARRAAWWRARAQIWRSMI